MSESPQNTLLLNDGSKQRTVVRVFNMATTHFIAFKAYQGKVKPEPKYSCTARLYRYVFLCL